jgi:uncharacterized protein YbjT (DUF2867 family)
LHFPSLVSESKQNDGPILLTGATGFVGRHLYAALDAAGLPVACGTRDPAKARERWPDREWVEVDLDRPHTLEPALGALGGCRKAVYLVHGMADGDDENGGDYAEREAGAARDFAAAAARAGLSKVVYLGGVAPAGEPSRHLASRLAVGEILRAGPVPTHELRAAMVVGTGGSSWRIVRDLAKRLPVMVLPAWLRNRSAPVFVDDVAVALLGALELPGTAWLDLPGPEVLSHRDLLDRVAEAFGYRPTMVEVPFVTPRLSSYWIGLVSGANLSLARELVEGLTSDLIPTGESVWDHLPGRGPTGLDTAIAEAIRDEEGGGARSKAWERAPTERRTEAIRARVQ